MIEKSFQVIILGSNLTGLAAAKTLAERGVSVAKVELLNERPIRGLLSIDPTSFNQTELTGSEFSDVMDQIYHHAQVFTLLSFPNRFVERDQPGLTLKDEENTYTYSSQYLIYCPYLCPPFSYPQPMQELESLMGYATSICAWSDAIFCRGKKVVVVGSGDWAVEQALIVSRFTNQVTIVCPQPQMNLKRTTLAHRLNQESNIQVLESNDLVNFIRPTTERTISGITCRQGNTLRDLPCDFLFLATEAEDGKIPFNIQIVPDPPQSPFVYQAGTVTGIHYAEHDQLVNDGFRVARAILKALHLDD